MSLHVAFLCVCCILYSSAVPTPVVSKVSGCLDSNEATYGCPTTGGKTITITSSGGTFATSGVTSTIVRFGTDVTCLSPTLVSANEITCTLPAATGTDLAAYVTQTDGTGTGTNAPSDPILAILTYLTGGLIHSKEGKSIVTDFTSYSATDQTAGSWMYDASNSDPSLMGKGFDLPTETAPGLLDSTMWRASGLYGSSSCSNKNYASNFDILRCATPFGAQTNILTRPSPAGGGSKQLSDLYDGRSEGGVMSLKTSSTDVKSSLGFVPMYRGSLTNDFVPGYVDLRLTNSMDQMINAIGVRYNLQCANVFPNSTTVSLQYTGFGSDDWYFNPVSGSEFTTPSDCWTENGCGGDCGTLDSPCWTTNTHFGHYEITGINWKPDESFFLRFMINSDVDKALLQGDPCRLLDIETIPYSQQAGDNSMEFRRTLDYVDITGGNSTFWLDKDTNFTVSMWVRPSKFIDLGWTSGKRTEIDWDMWLWGGFNTGTQVEQGWVIQPGDLWALAWKEVTASGTSVWNASSIMLTPNQWTHLAFVHYKQQPSGLFRGRVIVDGVDTGTALMDGASSSTIGSSSTGSVFRLGRRPGSSTPHEHYIGHLDEVRVWNFDNTESNIAFYKDEALTYQQLRSPDLLLYMKFDEFDIATRRTYSSKVGGSISYYGSRPESNSSLSTFSALTLAPLSGGTVSCDDKYTVPGGQIACNMSIVNIWGVQTASFVSNRFAARVIDGPLMNRGQCGPADPDDTGAVWRFTYFAGNATGTVHVQAFDHGDAFAGNSFKIHVVPQACHACIYRETYNGDKIYSCEVDGHRFLRRNIQSETGTCPS